MGGILIFRLQGFLVGCLIMAGLLLAACGDNTASTAQLQPTTTPPTSTPQISAAPTITPAASPTPAQPAQVIAPVTVTPVNNPKSDPTTVAATTASTNQTPASPPAASTPASVPATVAPSRTAAPVPTTAPAAVTAAPVKSSNLIFYLKDSELMAALPGEATPRRVARNVFSYTRAGDDRVVFLQQTGSGPDRLVQLKLAKLAGTQIQESLLDTRLFVTLPANQQNDLPAGLFGLDTRAMGDMAISPDGRQVAYSKANMGGPTFDGMFENERPTELWLANLDPANPQPRRLVANDKDYIVQPLWSSDNSRIAFIRTAGFGTGAGYQTALWSVFRDGSRLAFLTGPDLGKVNGKAFSASPAYNLRWVGPMLLGFQATNQVNDPIFLHDLNQQSDFPAALASDAASNAVYCAQAQHYVYIKQGVGGAGTAGAYSVSVAKSAKGTALLDKDAVELFGCEGNSLLYRTGQGQLVLARINPDGTLTASKNFKLENNSEGAVEARLAPGGNQAVFQHGRTTRLINSSGQETELKTGQVKYETLLLSWVSDNSLIGLAFTPGQTSQLLVLNIGGDQSFMPLDAGKVFSLAEPGQSGKGEL